MEFANEHACIVFPPAGAVVLFDGRDSARWVARGGGACGWRLHDDYLEVVPGTGDIHTRDVYRDFQLHLEFWLPYMPQATGQDRANSGVYLQGLYEIQILDSFEQQPADNTCGALYRTFAPAFNACKRPQVWQSYDVIFRAPRLPRPGTLSVLHNGIAIHNHVPVEKPTGAGLQIHPNDAGPILLQDHGNKVRFRNIWLLESP